MPRANHSTTAAPFQTFHRYPLFIMGIGPFQTFKTFNRCATFKTFNGLRIAGYFHVSGILENVETFK